MSDTMHHKTQKNRHNGHDYGARYKCNTRYCQSYGVDGRNKADSERRIKSKKIIHEELKMWDGQ